MSSKAMRAVVYNTDLCGCLACIIFLLTKVILI
jgi:hypothetical protein